jgi:hypothetical protein
MSYLTYSSVFPRLTSEVLNDIRHIHIHHTQSYYSDVKYA